MVAKNGNGNGSLVAPWTMAIIGGAAAVFMWVWGQISPKTDIGQVEFRLTDMINRLEKRDRDELTELTGKIRNMRDTLEKEMTEVKVDLKEKLPKEVHVEFASHTKDIEDRLQIEIDHVLDAQVPRKEYEQQWLTQNDRINGARDQIVEVRRDLTGSASIGKQLDNLQQQILDIRHRQDMPREPQVVAPNATIRTPGP